MERINIITGHFGSGKSEISIHLAKKLRSEGKTVTIVDLDIVNPFFCIRDLQGPLNKEGICVIAANPEWSNAELMMVPGQVSGIFVKDHIHYILDIGGDDSGANVLGTLYQELKDLPYHLYFVVNTQRPLTEDDKGVKEYIADIQRASRLKVTHLISNTNLSYETEVADILEGEQVVQRLSKELGIPHRYTVVMKELADQVKDKLHAEMLDIDIYMKPPWR